MKTGDTNNDTQSKNQSDTASNNQTSSSHQEEQNNNTKKNGKHTADNTDTNNSDTPHTKEETTFEEKIDIPDKNTNTQQAKKQVKKHENNHADNISPDQAKKEKKKEQLRKNLDHTEKKPIRQIFFDAIAVWNLKDEYKGDIAQEILSQVHTKIEYRSQMILSAVIATLGLLINSTAVVIGAMLIAPILRPIQAVSFSISTGNKKLFLQGMRLLLLSIFFSVITGILITWMIPLGEMTQEILIRTQPTLIDLCIAFASGIIAFLSFGYKKISTSIAGVAMAASLVPPLVVIGVGIGMENMSIARGSSVLLMTNLIAIIFAGIIIFYLFGYAPNQAKEFKTSLLTTLFSVIIMIILAVPLAGSLFGIIDSIQERNTITSITQQFLTDIDERISLEGFETQDDRISLALRAPESIDITKLNEAPLTQQLADRLERNITLEMSITPYITTSTYDDNTQQNQTISNALLAFFNANFPDIIIIDTKILSNLENNIVYLNIYNPTSRSVETIENQLQDYFDSQSLPVDRFLIEQQ